MAYRIMTRIKACIKYNGAIRSNQINTLGDRSRLTRIQTDILQYRKLKSKLIPKIQPGSKLGRDVDRIHYEID